MGRTSRRAGGSVNGDLPFRALGVRRRTRDPARRRRREEEFASGPYASASKATLEHTSGRTSFARRGSFGMICPVSPKIGSGREFWSERWRPSEQTGFHEGARTISSVKHIAAHRGREGRGHASSCRSPERPVDSAAGSRSAATRWWAVEFGRTRRCVPSSTSNGLPARGRSQIGGARALSAGGRHAWCAATLRRAPRSPWGPVRCRLRSRARSWRSLLPCALPT